MIILDWGGGWEYPAPGSLYRCAVWLIPEPQGEFSVLSQLPGSVSQGDTEDEALVNIKEVLQGCIRSYTAEGKKIPWSQEAPVRDGLLRYVTIRLE